MIGLWVRRWGAAPLVALGIALGAGGLCAVALRRALDIEPLAAAAPSVRGAAGGEVAPSSAPSGAPSGGLAVLTDDALDATVERAPFRPDREPPALRFGESAEVAAAPAPANAPPPPAEGRPMLRLAGTVVQADGRSFVMCEWMAEPARVVRIGDTVGGFTLRAVHQGWAVFRAPSGEAVELRVPKPGA